uniref:Uncharacterized protein n=1 Tax=Solanum lycopersicum TaxID=4081 RepID=K4D8D3_SOLLC
MAQLRQEKESKKHLTTSCMLHLARRDIAQLEEDRNVPLKESIEMKMGYQECRGGRMGSLSDLVWIVHGRQLESAALPGFSHLRSLGKRIKLALANSLMHYIPSTL